MTHCEDHHGHSGAGHGAPGGGVTNMKNQHAFFLVGTTHLFLVHMINSWIDCHRYQLVLKATLPEGVREKWLDDRTRHPEPYILGNLAENLIALPDVQRGAVRQFVASLWRGMPKKEAPPPWPWALDDPIVASFPVEVERVVYYRRLDFNQDYPRTASYLLFGQGSEAYLNHMPVKQPHFDHLVKLVRPPDWLPPELLEAGVPVNFPRVPAVPGGHECREALHESDPLAGATQYAQYSGVGPVRPLELEKTEFFGSWPFNRSMPHEAWEPCAEGGHE